MKEENKSLATALFNVGAIKFGEFRLKLHEKNPDAPLSPIYIDLRILRSFPGVLEQTGFAYYRLTDGLIFNYYADVPTASTPIVTILSSITRTPMISPRMEVKTHGVKGKIDGIFEKGQVVLLIDDLITTAGSKLEAISILEENGLRVYDVAVLVDREQGGAQLLVNQGYACHTVFRLTELLELYVQEGMIKQDMYKQVTTYLREFS